MRRAFRETATALRRRVVLFLGLPLGRLDTMAIQARVREIGTA